MNPCGFLLKFLISRLRKHSDLSQRSAVRRAAITFFKIITNLDQFRSFGFTILKNRSTISALTTWGLQAAKRAAADIEGHSTAANGRR